MDPNSQNKPFSFFDELFLLEKINTIDHNTKINAQQPNSISTQYQQAREYQPSQITAFLLHKIKQNEYQPWKLLNNVPQLIQELVKYLTQGNKGAKYQRFTQQGGQNFVFDGTPHLKNQQSIFIGEGTVIQHGTMITGPCFIGSNCQIRKGAYIRGGAIVGDGSLLGNSCQLKNAILMDRCQIAHFNYIGDSILGIHAHFAAGAIISNYKLDGSLIKMAIDQGNKAEGNVDRKELKTTSIITTDRSKLGAIVGHNVEIGCNAVLNPGSIIGRNSVIYPLTNWRGYLGANKICKLIQSQTIVEKKQI